MKGFVILFAVLAAAGCTDAGFSKFVALGNAAHVICYSGGRVIFDGRSTGKVGSENQSDGYYFRDVADGMLKEVSGDCVITYDP